MKYSVSTLAFPGYKVEEGLRISSKIGLDGVDIRVEEDEHIPVGLAVEERKRLLKYASSLGLVFPGVYGYVGENLVSANPRIRDEEINSIKAYVDLAVDLRAEYVRLFPGTPERTEENIQRFVRSCRKVANYALDKDVVVGLENHGELAHEGKLCRRLIEEIGLDNVKIIFDPANLQRFGLDPVKEGREMWDYIGYIHLKDWKWKDRKRIELQAVLVGEGEVNISGVIDLVQKRGYEGWLCLEYEKKWHPELPDPEQGLSRSLDYIRNAFQT